MKNLLAILMLLLLTAAAWGEASPRYSRHALIIGVSEYDNPAIPPLAGVKLDMDSARLMAEKMAIPASNMAFLRDKAASAAQIRQAFRDLNARVQAGDRVFVYYSGHGTRWYDANINKNDCTEGLLAADGIALTNIEIGDMLKEIAAKTDKLLVFYDACFSGGVANTPFRTRSIKNRGDIITPKFTAAGAPEQCRQPSNFRTRSLSLVVTQQVGLPQNIVHIAASRPDEVSFDNPKGGGFATTSWRDCFLGEARDLDGSGAITVEEITQCAQAKLNTALAGNPSILGQNMVIGGNKAFVPVHFATANPPDIGSTALNPGQILEEVHQQRDARLNVNAVARQTQLRIGIDPLELEITPQTNGYLYIALAGSDQKSLYLLYPNDLDKNNRVQAGQTLHLPRQDWRIYAEGPAGEDKLLVMVTDAPRDLTKLAGNKVGNFMEALMDAQGRARLQELLTSPVPGRECEDVSRRRNLQVTYSCSDAFGSALLTLHEVP